jgi:hypothetical protein
MPVTDDQAEALRLLLRGDMDGHRELYGAGDPAGYDVLVAAALCEALLQFSDDGRLRRGPVPDTFRDWSHADVADGSRDDVTHGAPGGANVLRLMEFLAHIQLSEGELDALLARARIQADEMMAIRQRGVTAIPDAMVAALRTYLACVHEDLGAAGGSPEQLGRQLALQVQASGGAGFEVLVFAAFIVAARRRFEPSWSPQDIAGYVARLRGESPEMSARLDAGAAENQLRIALGDMIAPYPDVAARVEAQMFLLDALTVDCAGDAVDGLLARARVMADQLLAARDR